MYQQYWANWQVISLGVGVQSTTLTLLNLFREIENPTPNIIFADTGLERAPTYDYLYNVLIPFIQSRAGNLYIVRAERSLRQICEQDRCLPSVANRWCTEKAKIVPIEKLAKALRATVQQVGISTDESVRARPLPSKRYPLLEIGFSRKDCMAYIKSKGLPIPTKSGCLICPFASRNFYKNQFFEARSEFEYALWLENRAIARRHNPNNDMTDSDVEEFYKKFPKQRKRISPDFSLRDLSANLECQPQLAGFDVENDFNCPSYLHCML
jgi:3'-phosphoadenosine 5'-phosphosulfate sulfotransferase (PAPS reductase)/FAD synthetase